MNRRELLALTGAALLVAGRAEASYVDYIPGLVSDRLAAGETVFAEFYAPWCGTCRAQERHIDALRSENPAYDAAMTFVRVDWDTYGRGDLAQRLQIPRRSTLVVLRGEAELGRIVAGTRRADIAALMDLGLG
ncbi:thioredoxin [Rhodobacteraceae bacterium W635]|uniref:thioredoxin family protein n=1 Tax=Nioella halotolerans TaxID=2303578 RepID=UPI000E3BD4A7|nr:thioredoxin [Rhodobacteraceae bacterium W635]